MNIYEYMLGKIQISGQNGQFRTPRHIIRMMVELMERKPEDTICDIIMQKLIQFDFSYDGRFQGCAKLSEGVQTSDTLSGQEKRAA